MTPVHYIRIRNGVAVLDDQLIARSGNADPAEMYNEFGGAYPKFFKMDKLSKWAWLGAERLLRDEGRGWRYEGVAKKDIAVAIATTNGCLEVDKRYNESRAGIASPALFVYTLPNIMLGEICIRHGFTGEQLCEVHDAFDADALLLVAKDFLGRRGATHCLFGYVDALDHVHDVCLFWADAQNITTLEASDLERAYAASGRQE